MGIPLWMPAPRLAPAKPEEAAETPSALKSHLTEVSSISSFQKGPSLPKSLLESISVTFIEKNSNIGFAIVF